MRRTRKIVGIVAAAVVVLTLIAVAGGWAYLQSDSAKQLVAGKVSERIGGEVRITDLSLGASSTRVELSVPGGDPTVPLLTGRVNLDQSGLALARGADIGTITVTDAVVALRIDESGEVVTDLPKPKPGGKGGPLPLIQIENGAVQFRQAGRPVLGFTGVNGTAREVGDQLQVEGTIADPNLGNWTVSGQWASSGDTGLIHLDSAGPVPLTPERLRSIPFVPASTWESIQAEGNATLKVQIGRVAGAKWTWRVEVTPVGATIIAKAIGDLTVTGTTGQILVDGQQVTATGMHGEVAGGNIKLAARLDFAPEPSKMHFDVDARGLQVEQLPKSLKLSGRVENGRLDGVGTVDLLVGEQVKPVGVTGKATLKGKLLGGEADVTVTPRVVGDELQFDDGPTARAGRPNNLYTLVALAIQAPAAPAAKATPKPPEYLKANLKLRDVDLAQLLQKANVELPVKIAGKVTLEVAAEIPTNSPGTVRAYRAQGKVSLPTLQIQGLTLNTLAANVTFREGVLTLEDFSAKFPAAAGETPPGFVGTARFGVDPRTELVADLKLDRIPLGQLFAAIPGLEGKAAGGISGAFKLQAPGDKFDNIASYNASGNLTSESLTVYGQKAQKVNVDLVLKEGVARLSNIAANLYQGGFQGQVAVPLAADTAGEFNVTFKGIDTEALTKQIPDSPVKLVGVVNGKFVGTLPSVANFDATKIVGKLDLDAPKLTVQGVPTTKLRGNIGYKPGAIAYNLKGDAFGGDFDVVGEYPLGTAPATPPKAPPKGNQAGLGSGKLRINRVQLERLGPTFQIDALAKLRGELTVSLDYTLGSDGRPVGVGRLDMRQLKYGDRLADSNISSIVRLGPNGVELSSLTGRVFDGRIGGRIVYGYNERQARRAILVLDSVDAKALFDQVGVVADGRVSVRLVSSLGRDIRGGGTVTSPRATIQGIPVSDLRVPLTWSVARGARRVAGEVSSVGAAATVAGGRVTGRADATYRDSLSLAGHLDFSNLNVASLSGSNFGVGRATGSLDLSGNDINGTEDLVGALTARFGETDVGALPVLGTITPLLSPVAALTRFENGDLSARLGNSQVRIGRLALNSPSAKLIAEGTVNLNGRLDLDVVYATDSLGASTPALRLIARNIPAIGPIPVGLIVRISEALANRIVRIRVGGMVDRPAYSVNAARLLSENAIRYFTGQYTQNLVGGIAP